MLVGRGILLAGYSGIARHAPHRVGDCSWEYSMGTLPPALKLSPQPVFMDTVLLRTCRNGDGLLFESVILKDNAIPSLLLLCIVGERVG